MKRKTKTNHKMKMVPFATKTLIFIIFFALCIISCKSDKLSGIYKGNEEENNYFRIKLEDRKFFITDDAQARHAVYFSGDTISYGKWKTISKEFLLFESDQKFDEETLLLEVNGRYEEAKGDTVRLIIRNQIEDRLKDKNIIDRDIYYQLDIESNDFDFAAELMTRDFDTDIISFVKPEDVKIDKIFLIAIPKSKMQIRKIEIPQVLCAYIDYDNSLNTFEIDIPDLTYKYLSFLRMKTYVRYRDGNLIWNGNEYKKIKE